MTWRAALLFALLGSTQAGPLLHTRQASPEQVLHEREVWSKSHPHPTKVDSLSHRLLHKDHHLHSHRHERSHEVKSAHVQARGEKTPEVKPAHVQAHGEKPPEVKPARVKAPYSHAHVNQSVHTREEVQHERELWMKAHPHPTRAGNSSHRLLHKDHHLHSHRHEKAPVVKPAHAQAHHSHAHVSHSVHSTSHKSHMAPGHKAVDPNIATKLGHKFTSSSREDPDEEEGEGGVLDMVKDAAGVVKDTADAIDKTDKAAEGIIRDRVTGGLKDGEKQLMSSINIFRAAMCTTRPNILEHVKCMKFMTKHCKFETSGEGYCKEYIELLEKGCPVHENDSKYTKEACAWCKSMDCEYHSLVKEEKPAEPMVSEEIEEEKPPVSEEGTFEVLAPAPAMPETTPAPTPPPAPPAPTTVEKTDDGLGVDKKIKHLPPQGYDDWGKPLVPPYVDGESHSKDWRKEWPKADETEDESVMKICLEHPEHAWCKLYIKNPPPKL